MVLADQFRSFGFSVGLHVALFALLLVGVDMTRQVVVTPASLPVINATAVDQRVLDQELARLKQIEEAAAQAERERLAAIERKAEAERQKRLAEKRRIAEAKAQAKAEAERVRAAEAARREAKAREAEAARKAEEQARREREAQAQRAREAEEAARKAEEARQRAEREAEAKRQAELKREAEQAAREEEARRRAQLEEEAAALEQAAQRRRDETELSRYLSRVERSVMENFRIPAGERSRVCTLYIKLIPGGDVAEVKVTKSSGSAVFDRQAALAVRKAAPLPVPQDPRLFNQMREIQFVFDPEG